MTAAPLSLFAPAESDFRYKEQKAILEQSGWCSAGRPLLEPKFPLIPLAVMNIPLHSSPLEIFLRVFGDDAINHMIKTFNSSVRLSRSPYNALRRWEFIRYLGMHLIAQLRDELTLQQLFTGSSKPPGSLGYRRFCFIHQNRSYDPHLLYKMLCRSFGSYCGEGNSWALDELKSPWNGDSPLVTFTPRKPHPTGIDIWLVCARLPNGRPYAIAFKPRLIAGEKYEIYDIAVELLQAWGNLPTAHLTADAFYDVRALRNAIQGIRDGTHVYTLSGHSGRDSHLWRCLHTELKSQNWVAWKHITTGEYVTSFVSKKVFNTRTTYFVENEEGLVDQESAPRLLYKAQFGIVDSFNKLFYKKHWSRQTKSHLHNLFDSFFQMAVVNSFALSTNVNPSGCTTIVRFMINLAEEMLHVSKRN